MNHSSTPMSRRQFLLESAAIGSAVSATLVVSACTPLQVPTIDKPSATLPTHSATSDQFSKASTIDTARVAFVQSSDRADGVRRALAVLGLGDFAQKRVLIKPNFNSADPAPGSTHPLVLRTLIEELRARQAGAITVADRSGMGNTRRVMEQLGVFELSQELDFATTVLDEQDESGWRMVNLPDSRWQQGFPIAACCGEADVIVQACCLKTHRFGGHFTLSLKNSVGLVAKTRPGDSYNYMNELHGSPHQRTLIAEINAAYTPALIVMDGVEAFTTGGPDNGNKVASNVVLASADRVAIDAVGVAILRHFGTTNEVSQGRIFEQEQIARGVELGLGVTRADAIELVTHDDESAAYAAKIQQLLALG